jgi:hypothetical protein
MWLIIHDVFMKHYTIMRPLMDSLPDLCIPCMYVFVCMCVYVFIHCLQKIQPAYHSGRDIWRLRVRRGLHLSECGQWRRARAGRGRCV